MREEHPTPSVNKTPLVNMARAGTLAMGQSPRLDRGSTEPQALIDREHHDLTLKKAAHISRTA
ncbi:hypothetical protein [uncultured Gimesia sp.]|uniref:hypothetical protein n=1 Tax=uncultured Gimesia sp. TaxID=1678688 RepID=UPI0030D9B74E